jgi:hypothetical protein
MTSALLALALLTGSVTTSEGVDLAKLNRTIKKEPTYSGTPQYALLVFGAKGENRTWLVIDGESAYLDRNGDGDLTGDTERVALPTFKPSSHPFHEGEREVELGSVKDGQLAHTKLTFSQIQYRKTLGKLEGDQQNKAAEWQENLDKVHRQIPDRVGNMVSVELADPAGGKPVHWFAWVDQGGHLRFGDSPRTAPVIHFGGPLTMLVNPSAAIRPDAGKDDHFTVHIGTAGVGPGSFAYSSHDRVPGGRDVYPVIDVEYPPNASGAPPLRERYELKERC